MEHDEGAGIERVLFTADQLKQHIADLGAQIAKDYAGTSPVFVGVLKGVLYFMADLSRQVSMPLSIEFISISYFEGSGEGVRITKDLDRTITGHQVVMVEDILDTGMTLHYLLEYLRVRQPASLKVCTLLDKRARRLVDVTLDYVGFEVPDEFRVSYGLDYSERYGNLPFIGVLRPEAPDAVPAPIPPPLSL